MASKTQIIAARDTAGAAHRAAEIARFDAIVELLAHDIVTERWLGPGTNGFGPIGQATEHSKYLRDRPIVEGDVFGRAKTRAAAILATWDGS